MLPLTCQHNIPLTAVFKRCVSQGHVAFDRHRGADRNLRGHALLCQGEMVLEREEGMEGSVVLQGGGEPCYSKPS